MLIENGKCGLFKQVLAEIVLLCVMVRVCRNKGLQLGSY